jgi:hypothetical protein
MESRLPFLGMDWKGMSQTFRPPLHPVFTVLGAHQIINRYRRQMRPAALAVPFPADSRIQNESFNQSLTAGRSCWILVVRYIIKELTGCFCSCSRYLTGRPFHEQEFGSAQDFGSSLH